MSIIIFICELRALWGWPAGQVLQPWAWAEPSPPLPARPVLAKPHQAEVLRRVQSPCETLRREGRNSGVKLPVGYLGAEDFS